MRQAFSLIELMVAVSIIGHLGALALPAAKRVVNATRATAVANDLRVLAAAMTAIAQQTGSYPADTSRGQMPPTAAGHTKAKAWTTKTPIGGYYNWEPLQSSGGLSFKAGIAINSSGGQNVSTDQALLLAIDQRIDDGNLQTGNFRRWEANEPVFVIEF